MPLEEFAAIFLFSSMPQRVPTFIFDLISNAKAGSRISTFCQKMKNYANIKRNKNEF
jgi:hypothetical protein